MNRSFTLAILIALLLPIAAVSQTPSYVPTNGLIAYWPFNGNAIDASGHGWNGTVVGVTPCADRNGQASGAMQFNGLTQAGTDNRVVLVDNSIAVNNFNVQFGMQFSASAWVKISLDRVGPNGGGESGEFFHRRNQNQMDFVCAGGVLAGRGTDPYGIFNVSNYGVNGVRSLGFGEWHHYAWVYDGQTLSIYLDGVLDATKTRPTPAAITNQSSTLSFGKYIYYGGNTHYFYFNGQMDDVAIWNRALTSAEVATLYRPCTISQATITGATATCIGSEYPYSIPAIAGRSYAWTTSSNGTIAGTNSGREVRVQWSTPGAAFVRVRESDGTAGCYADAELSVTVNALPTLAISGPTVVCHDEVGVYTVNEVGGHSYLWSAPTLGSIVGSNTLSQIAVQWGAAGSETLVVRETVNATGCYSDASLLVTIKQRPAPTINGPTALCAGRDENYNVAALSGRTYAWVAPSMGTIISGQGTADVRIHWSSKGTGSIGLREAVNGVAGCYADISLSVTVTGSPTPVIEGKVNPTEGSKKNYTVSAISGSTYKWLQPTLGVIDGSSTASKVKIKWTAQGTDVVRVQETITATGCMTEVSLAVSVGAAKGKSDKNAANSDGDDLDEYTSNVGSFISVDPNPTTGTATVTVASEGALQIRIVDVRGRSVFEQRLPSAVFLEPRMIILDLSFLSTDLYRLLLISDQGVTSTPLQIMK